VIHHESPFLFNLLGANFCPRMFGCLVCFYVSILISYDGSILAIASSYTYEEGEKDHPEDNVYLKHVQDVDVRPRPKV